jgi:transcriptional regulator
MCLYLWKRRVKSERKVANLFFTILVIFLVFLGFLDIGCVVAIAGMDKHPVFTEVLCRMHILADIIFTSVSLVYIYSVTINEALITNYTKVRRVLGASLIVIDMLIYLLTFMLPIAYHTNINPNYLLICGPGMYPIYILSLMGAIASVIMIWKYKKTNPKELTVPVAYFSVVFLFFSIIVFVVFEYRFNMIYIMYVFLINALFFTVESQDTKLLAQAEESRREAEIANKAKSDFLSSISHEIRTPMNTILGFSQALLEEKNLTQDLVKHDVKDIKQASGDLLELINNILDISRIESGKETLESKEYRIEDLLMEINSVTSAKVSRDVLDFKINVDGNIPTKFKGDSDKIYKILVNTLANAISHTKFGSVSLDVGGAYVGENYKLSLIVANTGHEMTEAEFNRSFEDFSEEGASIGTDSVKLGLIVAKRLVDIMGGTIDFRNEKGKGTRYLISLDQAVVDDMKVGAISFDNSGVVERKPLDLSGKKVLVVDDNIVNIKLATRLLEQFNLEVNSCLNGRDCIDLIKKNHYDVLFLDHMMPDLDGIATVHILRDDGCTIPIIALTANSYSGSRDRYISEGFTDYLAKPFKYKDLHKILQKYLGGDGE